jgi:CDP-paratose 2-epimerase
MLYLITGGAGFIGINYAHRLLKRGEEVVIYDNLSRPGTEKNLDWLRATHGERAFRLVTGDVRDFERLRFWAAQADVIVHLAAQVAVTTSVADPRTDFEVNALGTFNVLEAARLSGRSPIVLYASTNKVYGAMEEVAVVEEATRYRYRDLVDGVPETQPLDFHSPYGCSKGTGDQYVRDYARIYGLPTVVLRQSCIYGPRQMGVEDQGWIAWFASSRP